MASNKKYSFDLPHVSRDLHRISIDPNNPHDIRVTSPHPGTSIELSRSDVRVTSEDGGSRPPAPRPAVTATRSASVMDDSKAARRLDKEERATLKEQEELQKLVRRQTKRRETEEGKREKLQSKMQAIEEKMAMAAPAAAATGAGAAAAPTQAETQHQPEPIDEIIHVPKVDRALLSALSGQVAGHEDGVFTIAERSFVVKACSPQEASFYQYATKEPPKSMVKAQRTLVKRMRTFLPTYHGLIDLVNTTSPPASPTELALAPTTPAIILENLARDYNYANVLDVKLGKQLWDESATMAKRARMDEVAAKTTSGQTGIRLTGWRTWNPVTSSFVNVDKTFGKSIDAKQMELGLRCFFGLGSDHDAQVVSDHSKQRYSPAQLPGKQMEAIIDEGVLPAVDEIIDIVKKVHFRMRGGSLLIAYEGDPEIVSLVSKKSDLWAGRRPATEKDDQVDLVNIQNTPVVAPALRLVDVRLIDFAHTTFTPDDGRDEGLLAGLETLRGLLAHIAKQARKGKIGKKELGVANEAQTAAAAAPVAAAAAPAPKSILQNAPQNPQAAPPVAAAAERRQSSQADPRRTSMSFARRASTSRDDAQSVRSEKRKSRGFFGLLRGKSEKDDGDASPAPDDKPSAGTAATAGVVSAAAAGGAVMAAKSDKDKETKEPTAQAREPVVAAAAPAPASTTDDVNKEIEHPHGKGLNTVLHDKGVLTPSEEPKSADASSAKDRKTDGTAGAAVLGAGAVAAGGAAAAASSDDKKRDAANEDEKATDESDKGKKKGGILGLFKKSSRKFSDDQTAADSGATGKAPDTDDKATSEKQASAAPVIAAAAPAPTGIEGLRGQTTEDAERQMRDEAEARQAYHDKAVAPSSKDTAEETPAPKVDKGKGRAYDADEEVPPTTAGPETREDSSTNKGAVAAAGAAGGAGLTAAALSSSKEPDAAEKDKSDKIDEPPASAIEAFRGEKRNDAEHRLEDEHEARETYHEKAVATEEERKKGGLLGLFKKDSKKQKDNERSEADDGDAAADTQESASKERAGATAAGAAGGAALGAAALSSSKEPEAAAQGKEAEKADEQPASAIEAFRGEKRDEAEHRLEEEHDAREAYHEKAVAAEEERKKGGLLGLFKKDSKKQKDKDESREADNGDAAADTQESASKERAGATAAGAAGGAGLAAAALSSSKEPEAARKDKSDKADEQPASAIEAFRGEKRDDAEHRLEDEHDAREAYHEKAVAAHEERKKGGLLGLFKKDSKKQQKDKDESREADDGDAVQSTHDSAEDERARAAAAGVAGAIASAGAMAAASKSKTDDKEASGPADRDSEKQEPLPAFGLAAPAAVSDTEKAREDSALRRTEDDEAAEESEEKKKKGFLGLFRKKSDAKDIGHAEDAKDDLDKSALAASTDGQAKETRAASGAEALRGKSKDEAERKLAGESDARAAYHDKALAATLGTGAVAAGGAAAAASTDDEKQSADAEDTERDVHEEGKKKGGFLGLFKKDADSKEGAAADDENKEVRAASGAEALRGESKDDAERKLAKEADARDAYHEKAAADSDEKKKRGVFGLFKKDSESKGATSQDETAEQTRATSGAEALRGESKEDAERKLAEEGDAREAYHDKARAAALGTGAVAAGGAAAATSADDKERSGDAKDTERDAGDEGKKKGGILGLFKKDSKDEASAKDTANETPAASGAEALRGESRDEAERKLAEESDAREAYHDKAVADSDEKKKSMFGFFKKESDSKDVSSKNDAQAEPAKVDDDNTSATDPGKARETSAIAAAATQPSRSAPEDKAADEKDAREGHVDDGEDKKKGGILGVFKKDKKPSDDDTAEKPADAPAAADPPAATGAEGLRGESREDAKKKLEQESDARESYHEAAVAEADERKKHGLRGLFKKGDGNQSDKTDADATTADPSTTVRETETSDGADKGVASAAALAGAGGGAALAARRRSESKDSVADAATKDETTNAKDKDAETPAHERKGFLGLFKRPHDDESHTEDASAPSEMKHKGEQSDESQPKESVLAPSSTAQGLEAGDNGPAEKDDTAASAKPVAAAAPVIAAAGTPRTKDKEISASQDKPTVKRTPSQRLSRKSSENRRSSFLGLFRKSSRIDEGGKPRDTSATQDAEPNKVINADAEDGSDKRDMAKAGVIAGAGALAAGQLASSSADSEKEAREKADQQKKQEATERASKEKAEQEAAANRQARERQIALDAAAAKRQEEENAKARAKKAESDRKLQEKKEKEDAKLARKRAKETAKDEKRRAKEEMKKKREDEKAQYEKDRAIEKERLALAAVAERQRKAEQREEERKEREALQDERNRKRAQEESDALERRKKEAAELEARRETQAAELDKVRAEAAKVEKQRSDDTEVLEQQRKETAQLEETLKKEDAAIAKQKDELAALEKKVKSEQEEITKQHALATDLDRKKEQEQAAFEGKHEEAAELEKKRLAEVAVLEQRQRENTDADDKLKKERAALEEQERNFALLKTQRKDAEEEYQKAKKRADEVEAERQKELAALEKHRKELEELEKKRHEEEELLEANKAEAAELEKKLREEEELAKKQRKEAAEVHRRVEEEQAALKKARQELEDIEKARKKELAEIEAEKKEADKLHKRAEKEAAALKLSQKQATKTHARLEKEQAAFERAQAEAAKAEKARQEEAAALAAKHKEREEAEAERKRAEKSSARAPAADDNEKHSTLEKVAGGAAVAGVGAALMKAGSADEPDQNDPRSTTRSPSGGESRPSRFLGSLRRKSHKPSAAAPATEPPATETASKNVMPEQSTAPPDAGPSFSGAPAGGSIPAAIVPQAPIFSPSAAAPQSPPAKTASPKSPSAKGVSPTVAGAKSAEEPEKHQGGGLFGFLKGHRSTDNDLRDHGKATPEPSAKPSRAGATSPKAEQGKGESGFVKVGQGKKGVANEGTAATGPSSSWPAPVEKGRQSVESARTSGSRRAKKASAPTSPAAASRSSGRDGMATVEEIVEQTKDGPRTYLVHTNPPRGAGKAASAVQWRNPFNKN